MSLTSSGAPAVIKIISPFGREDEIEAAETIIPGSYCEINTANELLLHNTADLPEERIFALEDALKGDAISDSYSDGDPVRVLFALPGDVLMAAVKSGEVCVIGTILTCSAAGTLEIGTTERLVAVALEAKTPSGVELVKVRII